MISGFFWCMIITYATMIFSDTFRQTTSRHRDWHHQLLWFCSIWAQHYWFVDKRLPSVSLVPNLFSFAHVPLELFEYPPAAPGYNFPNPRTQNTIICIPSNFSPTPGAQVCQVEKPWSESGVAKPLPGGKKRARHYIFKSPLNFLM